jgi:hypothetical protein
MSTIAETFGIPKKGGFVVGCEFEIEGVEIHDLQKLGSHSIKVVEDPSLRGYSGQAWEYITKPISKASAIMLHDKLYNGDIIQSCGPMCSDRCSIHVHVNFSDLTLEKTRQFILLYALIEPLFFKMVDESRQNNIYCVPLWFTSLNKHYSHPNLCSLVDKWSKYTAFNILPLGKQGSIEFRHLQGTADNKLFSNWLEAIYQLYKANLELTLKSEDLDNSFVLVLANRVFKDVLPLSSIIDLNSMKNSFLDVKVALLDPDKAMVIDRIKKANLEESI